MPVLVDTSVWFAYFRGGEACVKLDWLIDENLVVINDLILTELLPFLKICNQDKVVSLLNSVMRLPLEINWDELIEFQVTCLKNGLNGVGIPDLIIAQNAKQHCCEIYSLDNHFLLMEKILKLDLTGGENGGQNNASI